MDFPSKCPYCGKDNIPQYSNKVFSTIKNDVYTMEVSHCVHCEQPIFVVSRSAIGGGVNGDYSPSEIIHYYPLAEFVDFPKRIKALSPKSFNAYSQAVKAKESGYDMLVGAGLRIALEWLVWDYLIKVKGLDESKIKNLKLHERISLMNENFYTNVCSRLIRLFGNDSVHIIKQLDFSVEEVIEVFQLLCSLIDSELQIKEVNSRLPKKN